jgi:hypothetical protein
MSMDWAAAPDRPKDGLSAWHADSGKPFFDILYGDDHVEGYLFKTSEVYPAVGYSDAGDTSLRNYW